jgi:SAM-dependent methyltransferase
MNDDPARLISVLRQLPPPRRALDLGCGDCRDAAAYYESGWTPDTLLVGLDLDFHTLHQANKSAIHPVQADLTRLPLRARFDLILVRHPDVARQPAAWEFALNHLIDWLADPGFALITTYGVSEVDSLRGWIAGSALKPLALDTSRLAAPGLAGRDRFVMVYLKTGASRPRSPA